MIWVILFLSLLVYLYGAGRMYGRLLPRCVRPDEYDVPGLVILFCLLGAFPVALWEGSTEQQFEIYGGDVLIGATLFWPLVFLGHWTGRAIRKTWRVFLMGPGTIFRLAIRKGIQHEEKRQ